MSGRSTSRRHRLKQMKVGPYWEGAAAFNLGKSVDACPYGPDVDRGKAHSWHKGWKYARRAYSAS